MAEAILEREELGALVIEALETATRTSAEDKRWLLAKVLASAFHGDDARLDEVALLLRTARGLDASCEVLRCAACGAVCRTVGVWEVEARVQHQNDDEPSVALEESTEFGEGRPELIKVVQ